jgi:hypothetical protein
VDVVPPGAAVVGSGTEIGGIVGVELVGQDRGRTTQLSAGAAADEATAPASAPAPSTRASAQAERIGWRKRGAGLRDRIAGGPSDEARLASHVTSTPVCQLVPQPVSKRSLVGVSKENTDLQLISPQDC